MTDTFLYSGELSPPGDLPFLEEIEQNRKSDECTLILVTNGGDPHSAYKIGRYIQSCYKKFSILVSGYCKSAGTMLATAANELIFTPYGELGPLDVQMRKEDKMLSMESGLNISEAFRAIENRAKDTYHEIIGGILAASDGVVSIRTALHAASEMVSSLYGPIFSQINPEEVGSRLRAMRIGEDYIKRLNSKWENLKPGSIDLLVKKYPSHSFVIDFLEAKELFNSVRRANKDEMNLVKKLGLYAICPHPSGELKIEFIDSNAK